jgi:hypothetical protein
LCVPTKAIAQALVLFEQVGVPGQHRNAGLLGFDKLLAHRRGVGRRDRHAVDLLGDQVGDDLHLLVAAAVLAGADVEALDCALQLCLGLLAAVAGLVEERVVGVLRHQREDVFLVRGVTVMCPERERDRDRRGTHQYLLHLASFLVFAVSVSVSNVATPATLLPPLSADPLQQNRENDEATDEDALVV